MSAAERLISSDDHVDLAHDAIKANLTTKYHAAYDAALMEFGMGMAKTMSSKANGLWRKQQGLAPKEIAGMTALSERSYPAAGRAGHTDAQARLDDMDADAVLRYLQNLIWTKTAVIADKCLKIEIRNHRHRVSPGGKKPRFV